MSKLLRFFKYVLLVFLLLTITSVVIFTYYTKKLDYQIPTTSNIRIYDNNEQLFMNLKNNQKQSYVSLDEISQNVIDAFIAIEDKRFFDHHGVDFIRIGGAIIANLEANALKEGASTITQQYARNLFLTQDKDLNRKLQEIMISMNLETKYSKAEILEGYLNTIYFDNGVYGIEDAALFYFDKNAKDLTLSESCILAAIPKGPSIYSPIKNFEANKQRKELILHELQKDNVITIKQMNEALAEQPQIIGRKQSTFVNAPYYEDIIIDELNALNILKQYDNQTINVYTSLDSNLNNIIERAITKYFPDDQDLQIAVVAINPNTKEVLSVIGGRDYLSSTYNRATVAIRQPGSTIKPFLYYAALENGFTPATTLMSTSTDFYVNGTKYSPQNFGNIYPDKEVTMTYALATSDNIYALKTHIFLGTETLVNTLREVGFTTPINNNVSLALGTSEVYLSELVNGYSTLASLGKVGKNRYITKITDQFGRIIYENKEPITQKLNKTTCYILSETLTNVFDNNLAININVTGAPIANILTHKYAGKSGSTDFDNLMVGYNSEIALGVWVGYDDSRLLSNQKTKFIKYIWAEIIEEYMKTNENQNGWYQKPNDVIGISLNPVTGEVASFDEYEKTLYFDINNIPWKLFYD